MRRLFPVLANFGVANGITTLGVVFGFVGILSASHGALRVAVTFLFGAILCDRLDGRIAYLLNEQSDFGGHLDSLSDGLSLCLFPAYLGYQLGLASPVSVAVLSLFLLAGLWRLADFNLAGVVVRNNRSYFRGIPTTVAAGWLLVAISVVMHVGGPAARLGLLGVFAVSTVLMISAVLYPKEGPATKVLHLAVPLGVLLVWLPPLN